MIDVLARNDAGNASKVHRTNVGDLMHSIAASGNFASQTKNAQAKKRNTFSAVHH